MNRNGKCTHTAFWVAIAVLGFIVLISMSMNLGFLIAAMGGEGTRIDGYGGEDEFPRFTERWSYGDGGVKVVRIPVEGLIFRERDDGFFAERYDKVELTLRQIRAAAHDENVKGIILEVNSPGGELTATDEIYEALRQFKAGDSERRIIAFTRNMAASGGYYVSMPADWIIAEPTAVIGSIGVIMHALNWKGLSEKIGITDTTIKSGENKDLLNPFHEVDPEDVAILQKIIDSFYNRFLNIVETGRGITTDRLKPIADGRLVTAAEALDVNLIDEIGYWPNAVGRTAELLGEEEVKVVRYEYSPGFFEVFGSIRSPLRLPRVNMIEPPRFMYLWTP